VRFGTREADAVFAGWWRWQCPSHSRAASPSRGNLRRSARAFARRATAVALRGRRLARDLPSVSRVTARPRCRRVALRVPPASDFMASRHQGRARSLDETANIVFTVRPAWARPCCRSCWPEPPPKLGAVHHLRGPRAAAAPRDRGAPLRLPGCGSSPPLGCTLSTFRYAR
jgi:hypothetical protein